MSGKSAVVVKFKVLGLRNLTGEPVPHIPDDVHKRASKSRSLQPVRTFFQVFPDRPFSLISLMD